jgi:hypothetical protein
MSTSVQAEGAVAGAGVWAEGSSIRRATRRKRVVLSCSLQNERSGERAHAARGGLDDLVERLDDSVEGRWANAAQVAVP